MPSSLTLMQLETYDRRIEKGGLNQVKEIYAELYANGYKYAGWAVGVAKGNTLRTYLFRPLAVLALACRTVCTVCASAALLPT